ncbi:MAG: hypothetical protein JNJ46_09240 [Myxococcales bacterium]|nr:hypothetical protein [Myxococcales bacterium]
MDMRKDTLTARTVLLCCGLLGAAGSGCTFKPSPGFGNIYEQLDGTTQDMADPSQDMATGPSCKAAAGLSGTRLLCHDFDGDPPPDLAGWNLSEGAGCAGTFGWEINPLASPPQEDKALQLKSFATFASGSCGVALPSLDSWLGGQHGSLTLALEHQVDFNEAPSASLGPKAEVCLDRAQTRCTVSFLSQGAKRYLRWTLRITRSELQSDSGPPLALQPVLRLRANGTLYGNAFAGWRIKSIAVLGDK